MEFARQEAESRADWLERLVNIWAPTDIRANVMALLDNERAGAAGNNLIPLIPNLFITRH